jgi:uncharacterized protein (TIGR02145 family)
MKRNIILIAILALVAFSVNAQNDSMYIMKSGVVVGQYHVNNQVDSVIFYKPDPNFVYDVEGNKYKVIKIGTQTWMAENLKATKYQNGDAIGTTDPVRDINGETAPKYQWAYESTQSNAAIYGRLYTWYAITDSRGVCPVGWRVPTDVEWTTLAGYLGGAEVAGGSLKESGLSHWESPNTGATNISGFTALPAGYSFSSGGFSELGSTGYWWTATHDIDDLAWYRSVSYNSTEISRYNITKKYGYSVRCIKE